MCVQPLVDRISPSAARGFTLIELIVGITLIAIVVTLLVSMIYPTWRQSAEPLVEQRAASLAEALMEEILSKRYDELTPDGGVPACPACSTTLGIDSGETRANFDDVDDYNFYCGSNVTVTDANNSPIVGYDNFRMQICVSYDGDYNGIADTNQIAKRITVTITPAALPPGLLAPIVFSAYRTNF